MNYVYTPLINKQYPNFSEMQAALKKADEIDWLKRDTRPLFSILNRMANTSPRISGHINTRRTAVSSFNWQLEGDEDYSEKQLILAPAIDKLIKNHIDSPVFGSQLVKLTWQPLENAGTTRAFVPNIERINPIDYMPVSDNEFALYDETGKTTLVNSSDSNEYLYYTENADYMGGIMRGVMPYEILLRENILEWNETNQRMKGIIAGMVNWSELFRQAEARSHSRSDTGALIDKSISDLETAIKAAGDNSYVIASDAAKIEMKNLVESSAPTSFSLIKTALDNDIAIAFLGQANTAQLPNSGGSRAALQVLNLIRSDILFSDQIRTEMIVNKLLDYDYAINGGGTGIAPYRFKWIFDDNLDVEANARTFETASRLNLSFITDEIYRKLDMTRPEGLPDVMKLTAQSSFSSGIY